ncbi:MAG TPA: Uma2 family endonuclease [Thermoanaerobaculia bacterium]|jgi:Uma2 family endonuclease
MAKALRQPATYEDLLKVPEHLVAELIDGELFTNPRPTYHHASAGGRLYRRLGNTYEDGDGGPGGWWILPEVELHLGGDALVPDIAGWRRERMPELPSAHYSTVVPDWVCEVISPSTGRLDRIRKMPVYASHGVPHAWLIDPMQKTLEVFRLSDGHWLLIAAHEGEDVVRAEPFDAIELNLGYLWVD